MRAPGLIPPDGALAVARYDEAWVADAFNEAAALSAGRVRDEPAALLHACAKRTHNLARVHIDHRLVIDDP